MQLFSEDDRWEKRMKLSIESLSNLPLCFFSLLPETIVTFSTILACFFKFEMTMPTSSLQRWEGGKDWRRAEKGGEASFSGFVGLRSDSVISAALAGDLKDALFGDSQSASSLRTSDLEVGCSLRLCHWLLSLWRHLVHRVLWVNFEPGTLWGTINESLSSLALSSITTPRRTAKISPKANILFRLSMQYRRIRTIRRWSVFFDNAQQTLTLSATVFDIFTASAPSITHGSLWSSWRASKEEFLLIFASFAFLMLHMLSHQRNIFHLWIWRNRFFCSGFVLIRRCKRDCVLLRRPRQGPGAVGCFARLRSRAIIWRAPCALACCWPAPYPFFFPRGFANFCNCEVRANSGSAGKWGVFCLKRGQSYLTDCAFPLPRPGFPSPRRSVRQLDGRNSLRSARPSPKFPVQTASRELFFSSFSKNERALLAFCAKNWPTDFLFSCERFKGQSQWLERNLLCWSIRVIPRERKREGELRPKRSFTWRADKSLFMNASYVVFYVSPL